MTRVKRNIIGIDEEKCTGCGLCLPNCPEGALQLVETPAGPKVRLVKESFCDGLGACLGNCPEGALSLREELVEEFDEEGVIENIKQTVPDKLESHLKHLKQHSGGGGRGEVEKCSCPSALPFAWEKEGGEREVSPGVNRQDSQLRQWPVQLTLVNPAAPYFKGSNLLIAADCVPFAYADFHSELLKGKTLVVGCPKLDDREFYLEKLTEIFKSAGLKSLTVVNMEVPCCFGLSQLVKQALKAAGLTMPAKNLVIGIKGELLSESELN